MPSPREQCPSQCEVGECRLRVFAELVKLATRHTIEAGAQDDDYATIVEAHTALLRSCRRYSAANHLADSHDLTHQQ